MAIRFRCQRCRQPLTVSRDKADGKVQCPKCGASQSAPANEAAATALAMDRLARNHNAAENDAEIADFEAEPATATVAPGEPPGQVSNEPAATPPPQISAATTRAAEPAAPDMILMPRRTIYVQSGLMLAFAVTAFAAGYLIGRGDARHYAQVREEAAVQQRVEISGRLLYEDDAGNAVADQHAAVFALPSERFPQESLPVRDLRPLSPPPAADHPSVQRIRQLGGAYARADALGDFSMDVPSPGDYRLLVISRHARRPAGSDVDASDLVEIRDYFELAEMLIDRCQYRWTLERVGGGNHRVEESFGRDQGP